MEMRSNWAKVYWFLPKRILDKMTDGQTGRRIDNEADIRFSQFCESA